jgi:pimeloyl-ACP methyl ester carboxylesterase
MWGLAFGDQRTSTTTSSYPREPEESQENTDDSVDGWSRLGELSIPTAVACGSFDATDVIRRSEVVGSRIPGAKYVSLEGMAHLPYLENPSAIATLIRDSI